MVQTMAWISSPKFQDYQKRDWISHEGKRVCLQPTGKYRGVLMGGQHVVHPTDFGEIIYLSEPL